jgi:hypothetical protein
MDRRRIGTVARDGEATSPLLTTQVNADLLTLTIEKSSHGIADLSRDEARALRAACDAFLGYDGPPHQDLISAARWCVEGIRARPAFSAAEGALVVAVERLAREART